MGTLSVHNKSGKQIDKIDLPENILDTKTNTRVLHQGILAYRASLRQGTASTKERASVHGSTRKLYRQKGTGRARVGGIRSPLFKGGGIVFGPHPRDFGFDLPRKIKRVALRESLKAKYQAKQLYCIEDLKESFSKTKEFNQILKSLKLQGKILAVLDGSHESILRVSRNIARIDLLKAIDVNAYDILSHKTLLMTKTAFSIILKRIKV